MSVKEVRGVPGVYPIEGTEEQVVVDQRGRLLVLPTESREDNEFKDKSAETE